ncbi:MAG: adenylate/guanylate cyclase domain-containing protein [Bacteroidota bacterium]
MEKDTIVTGEGIENSREADISQKLTTEDIDKIEKYRQTRKTSVLTILFTDIVGYTQFTYDAGEVASARLRHIHDEIIISQVRQEGHGEIIKQIGDSFLIVFSDPTLAVKLALKLQDQLRVNADNLTFKNYQLKIRIGLHMGQVSVEEHIVPDVFGTHVNLAARVMSLATGGQVITSGSVWENASGWLKEDQEINAGSVYYGKIKLKGIGKATEIYEFFDTNTEKIGIPKPLLINKRKHRLIWIGTIAFFVIAMAGAIFYLSDRNLRKSSDSSENERGIIFLADIESNDKDIEYLKRLNKKESEILDSNWNLIESIDLKITGEINERYYEQLKTSFIIDYDVKTEQEEKQKYAEKGLIFTHDVERDTNLYDENLAIIIPHLYKFKNAEKYLLLTEIPGFSYEMVFTKVIDSVPLLVEKFTKSLLKWMDSYYYSPGSITKVDGNDIIIKFWETDKIPKPGLLFRSFRHYIDYNEISDQGVQRKLNELKKAHDYYKSVQEWIDNVDTVEYNWSYAEYQDLINGLIKKKIKSKVLLMETGIYYKIINVFDSTALATVYSKKFPFLVPEVGDQVHLK